MRNPSRTRGSGFTLVELMVTVAVVVLLITLAAPSFTQLIGLQRLRSVNAELVTALQYARSEAVARNRSIQFQMGSSSTMTCYMVFIQSIVTNCDCTRTPGSACSSGIELRTTQVLRTTDIELARSPSGTLPMSITPNGPMDTGPSFTNFAIIARRASGAPGRLQTSMGSTGRPTVCSPDASVNGAPAC
jgi:type IV fimbrial biogenesis protein FimT